MTVRGFWVGGCVLQLGLASSAGIASTPEVPARQEVPIEETYRRQCAACHGEQGRGDGRMARRFKPPPADFLDPNGIAKRTDEELVEVIIDGRASMPAFGDVLSEEVVAVLVAYLRDLSRGVER